MTVKKKVLLHSVLLHPKKEDKLSIRGNSIFQTFHFSGRYSLVSFQVVWKDTHGKKKHGTHFFAGET